MKSRDPLDDLNEAKRAPLQFSVPSFPPMRGNARGPRIGEVFGLPNEALKFLVPPENRAIREITRAVSSPSSDFLIFEATARWFPRRAKRMRKRERRKTRC